MSNNIIILCNAVFALFDDLKRVPGGISFISNFFQKQAICEEIFAGLTGCSVKKSHFIYACGEDSCILDIFEDLFAIQTPACLWAK